jgi:hypothetical protein
VVKSDFRESNARRISWLLGIDNDNDDGVDDEGQKACKAVMISSNHVGAG